MSAILDCELRPSCLKSRVGPDRFEISVPKLPCVPIFMLLSLISTIRPLNIWTKKNIHSLQSSILFTPPAASRRHSYKCGVLPKESLIYFHWNFWLFKLRLRFIFRSFFYNRFTDLYHLWYCRS